MSLTTAVKIELEQGAVIEISGCGGIHDGCLMGYVIRFAGGWDGWCTLRADHQTMRQVCVNLSTREAAEEAVIRNF